MENHSRNVNIVTLRGREILQKQDQIARLRIEVFREYPYLYDGSMSYEQTYLQTYADSQDSIAILLMDGDRVAGVSTGLPMEDETDEFKTPFLQNGWNPKEIFYCGESIMEKPCRGRGFYSSFIRGREEHARSLNRFRFICFCAVVRPDTHPLKPEHYQPLDPVWTRFGYKKQNRLTASYTWKDLNEKEETPKKMVFWVKQL